jgi:hypothetical protein
MISYYYVNFVATDLHASTPKMETAYTSETSAISYTITACNNPRTELKSIINYRENLKSVVDTVLIDFTLRLYIQY